MSRALLEQTLRFLTASKTNELYAGDALEKAIRAELVKPAQQKRKPDKYDSTGAMAAAWFGTTGTGEAVNAVFPSEAQQERKPITEYELAKRTAHISPYDYDCFVRIARAVEAHHKIGAEEA